MSWKDGLSDEGGYARYGDSPLYDPPDGWKILIEADWAGAWEFSTVAVWRNEASGELRAAADSGCSCPTPFSDLTLEGMKPINEVEDLRSLVESGVIHDEGYSDLSFDAQNETLADLKAKVHRALRDKAAA